MSEGVFGITVPFTPCTVTVRQKKKHTLLKFFLEEAVHSPMHCLHRTYSGKFRVRAILHSSEAYP